MAGYPEHWAADVVLADGGTVHLRPITPEDADRLVAMHSRLSQQTIYYRFFGPFPKIPPRDLERFTTVDYRGRMALIALLGDDIIAVGRYERLTGTADAEVAFVVEDAHQGRGVGTVLLEHLAAVARECGIERFVAEVLPTNRRMLRVFGDAGYPAVRTFEQDSVHVVIPLEPTAAALEASQAREHRAEARSIARLLSPTSVAVIGASEADRGVGRAILADLMAYGFRGPVYPVHPTARHIGSVRAYPTVLDIPDDVDLAVIAIPAAAVLEVVTRCARKGVKGLVVVSSGFGETGAEGRERQQALVTTARAHGMRVVGPNCLGVINTHPDVRLNATLASVDVGRGRVGFFSQSGALGIAILEEVGRRGIGLSTFVSAGNRGDVSGNDLLQYWEEDPDTDIVLLYLESFGNPRKFARIARRLGRRKPVVAVKTGRTTSGVPLGHRGVAVSIPDEAVDALFRQAGVVRVDTLAQLFDVAQVLAFQPLPPGRRVAIVGNSTALGVLAVDACHTAGLIVARGGPLDLGSNCTAEDFRAALEQALADPEVDAIVTVFVPPLTTPGLEVAQVLAETSRGAEKPIVSTFLAIEGVPAELRREVDGVAGKGSVPSYASPESAVAALAKAVEYAEWRRRPAAAVPELPDIDPEAAREVVGSVLAETSDGRELDRDEVARLFAAYGLSVLPTRTVTDPDAAVAAAEELGWPVAVKTSDERLRHRVDLGGVRLDIAGAPELRAAVEALQALSDAPVEVQPMAAPGVAVVVGTQEDPSFGVLVTVGVAGAATELLGDRSYAALPITDADARDMVASLRAAPVLLGWRGADPVDVPALEDLLVRVGRLADHNPEVTSLLLDPVVVSAQGCTVLSSRVQVAPVGAVADTGPRRLR
jgi:acyl-CoA synthetase (NDP forming)/GNAT superfamily N-acetyltransferase